MLLYTAFKGVLFMEIIVESVEHIYQSYKMIGLGYESRVFLVDENTVLKLFLENTRVRSTLSNKFLKFEELSQIGTSQIIVPEKIVMDNSGRFLGYTMKRVLKHQQVPDFICLPKSSFTLKEKIAFYRDLEALVKYLHKKQVTMVDTNPENFIFNRNFEINLVDTDCYAIGQFSADAVPVCYADYFLKKTHQPLSQDVDKFSLAIRFLEMAVEEFDCLEPACMGYYNYPERMVSYLDVPQELQNVFYELFSENGKKEYIGDYLDMIPNQDKKYIRSN